MINTLNRQLQYQDWENQDSDNQDLENLEFSENFYNKFCEIKL